MAKSFLIAAPNSGSGKTTIAIGLMRALVQAGFSVSPFKCGPDYIDTKFHSAATGRESVNLDRFFSSEEHIKELFATYSQDSDIAIIEGMMGLFDGYNREKGSSADISMILNVPVIMVVNASSTAYSIAPLLYGYKEFNKNLKIAGVIFNKVSGERHYNILKNACLDIGLNPIGYLCKDPSIEVPSRHLGLNTGDSYTTKEFIDKAASVLIKSIDIGKLLETVETRESEEHTHKYPVVPSVKERDLSFKIAIANDEAFNFTYKRNIDVLSSCASIIYFSPIRDKQIPEVELIYLPGGYPELFLKELSENRSMLRSIKEYGERGGKILAECGGMLYLSHSISDKNGNIFEMAKLLPLKATMESAKLRLGYRMVHIGDKLFRGHEFHYSSVMEIGEAKCKQIGCQKNAQGEEVNTPIYRYKNIVAGYTHLYWGDCEFNTLLKSLFTDHLQ